MSTGRIERGMVADGGRALTIVRSGHVELTAAERGEVAAAARRAAQRFPWYWAMLGGGEQVPILREAALETTYYAADGPLEPDTRAYLTSGTSTGIRKRVDWTAADHDRYITHRAELLARFFAGECRTACADLGTGHAAASAPEIFERIGVRGSEIDFRWPIERHVEILRTERPEAIFTMPMILERIIAAGGPGYTPRRVVVVGDIAPPEWRAAIGRRLGMDPVNMMDVFGSIEVGAIAYSDDATGAYLFHEHIIPELIPGATPRADDPDAGLLALTSLERDSFPVVRYVSGDVVSGLATFETDGRRRWGYLRHLGREGSELKHGEMLSLHSIAVALAEAAPGVAWAVRRAGMEVVIEIESSEYSGDVADAVRSAVREANPDVDQMIVSGLVGDIGVEPRDFTATTGKRISARP